MTSGSFFERLLSAGISLGMSRTGCDLAPAVPRQHAIHRGLGHRVTDPLLVGSLDLTDDQDPASFGLLKKTL